jgi:hypothetical protein
MEIIFFLRYEYWHEFLSIEVFFWFELLVTLAFIRINAELFWPLAMVVNYTLSNFEYWPINDVIDFVLAIPHWYLRPLMSSLVLIPHHYIGFFYIIVFFLMILYLPWFSDNTGVQLPNYITDYLYIRFPMDLNINSSYFFFLLVLLMSFTTLIVPTGKYFIAAGSSEILVFAFWYIIFYFLFFQKFGHYLLYLYYHYNV